MIHRPQIILQWAGSPQTLLLVVYVQHSVAPGTTLLPLLLAAVVSYGKADIAGQTQILSHAVSKMADDRKRYIATIPRHRAVPQNTPKFLTRSSTLIGQFGLEPVFDTNSLRNIVPRLLSSAVTLS